MTLKPNRLNLFFLLLVFWSQELRKGGVARSWKSDGVATALTGSYGGARLTTGCLWSLPHGRLRVSVLLWCLPSPAQALQEKQMKATWPLLAEL